MQQIIKVHNNKIINVKNYTNAATKTYYCRQQSKCLIDGNCISNCIIYKENVVSEKQRVSYIRMTMKKFKDIYNNHNKSSNHKKYENKTELSKQICKLKKKSNKFNITRKIMSHATTRKRLSNQCNVCF